MTTQASNDPLHGITLQAMLEHLVERRGWDELAARIRINCFANDPSVKSSLKFLRKTKWARQRVEDLYLEEIRQQERNRKRNKRRAAMRAERREREAAAQTAGEGASNGTPTNPSDDSP